MTLLFLVWIVETLIPAVKGLMALSFTALGVMIFALFLAFLGDDVPAWKKLYKVPSIACLCFITIGALFPSKDTAYLMIGAYGVEYLATHDTTKRLGSKTLGVLESSIDKLDLYLKENETKVVEPAITAED